MPGPNNRLSRDPAYEYTYDDEGNVTRETSLLTPYHTWTYEYDHANQLTRARQVSGNTGEGQLISESTYRYDVFGNRIEQMINSGGQAETTRFAYDGVEVVADMDTSNHVKRRYLRGDAVDHLFGRIDASGDQAW